MPSRQRRYRVADNKWITPPEFGRIYGIGDESTRQLIASGELQAIDISPPSSKRPRYRISPDARRKFEEARLVRS